MDREELVKVLHAMHEMAEGIVNHQLEVFNDVHEELRQNLKRPFEQDYIYKEQFGRFPSEPVTTIVHGVQVATRILHQTGKRLSDIKGADLLYEISGEKFALIQFKRAENGRIKVDSDQLKRLLHNCPKTCSYTKSLPKQIPIWMNGNCGLFYRVQSNETGIKNVYACEAKTIFGSNESVSTKKFGSGISKDTFIELFASCRIGARIKRIEAQPYVDELLSDDHLIYSVLQNGKWTEKMS